MSRHEQDREDLLAEATALVERVELVLPGEPEPVVAGFRRGGELSLYFGADPVYQFNSAAQLRRAYVSGLLLKAERGRLVRLRRQRTGEATVLMQHELIDGELAEFAQAVHGRLQRLAAALHAGNCAVTRQVPEGIAAIDRLADWLARWLSSNANDIRIALTARI